MIVAQKMQYTMHNKMKNMLLHRLFLLSGFPLASLEREGNVA